MEKHGLSLEFILQHARSLVLFHALSASNKPQTNFPPKACLPEFESGPNPISGTGLVPIGILVSSANTHRTQVTQGACLRAQRPSKSSVKHASHKAKAYRAGQSSETHIQRSLMGAEARKDAVPKTVPAKSRRTVPGERPASTFCAVCKHGGATRKQSDPARRVLRPTLIKSVNQLWPRQGVT